MLMPAFQSTGAALEMVISNGGVSAAHAGRKYHFKKAATENLFGILRSEFDTIAIATRHDSHADYVRQGILARKSIFVEKPLALSDDQIDAIENEYLAAIGNGYIPRLMVGFNRRFAPHVMKMKSLLAGVGEPKAIVITVNAGHVPSEHWTRDAQSGGGRIVGEACHFVDLLRFLVGAPAVLVQGVRAPAPDGSPADTMSFSISFADGSIGTVHYFASGHRSFPKERGCTCSVVDESWSLTASGNFRGWGWKGFQRNEACGAKTKAQEIWRALSSNPFAWATQSPIPFEEIIEVTSDDDRSREPVMTSLETLFHTVRHLTANTGLQPPVPAATGW